MTDKTMAGKTSGKPEEEKKVQPQPPCFKCGSNRLFHIWTQADDHHVVRFKQYEHCDYLPEDMGIGGGSHSQFTYCGDCGQIQGKWPLVETQVEKEEKIERELHEQQQAKLEKAKATETAGDSRVH